MCMSRRELAEAANAYVWEHTGGRQRTNMTEHDIGRYERGEVHWPGDWRLFGLRGVLGVDSDVELGFYPNRKTSTSSVVTGHRPPSPDIDGERSTSTDTTATGGPPRGMPRVDRDAELGHLPHRHAMVGLSAGAGNGGPAEVDGYAAPFIDRSWWRSGNWAGRPITDALHAHDIADLFGFLEAGGWSSAAIAAAAGLPESRVRDIRQGRERVTSYHELERIAVGLDIHRGLLGLAYTTPDDPTAHPVRAWPRAGPPNTVEDMRRRSALALPALAATAIATVAAEPWNRLAHALANPGRLDVQTVEHLQGRTRDFFNREEHIPSRQLAADLRTHVAQLTKLVAGAPARFQRTLMSSLGEALALATWLAWDSGESATVQRAYEDAVAAARQADDGPLLACAYAYRSYLAEADSDLPTALDLLVNAQGYARGERSAGTRSWLAAREAEVAAALSDWTTALRALERALTAYDYAHPYDERSWTAFFAPSRLGSMAVTTYARLDHPELGNTTEAVIDSLPPTEVKTRAIILADIATAAILRGDQDQGVALGHRALDQALTQEVTVARQRLRHLHTTIGRMPAQPTLAELDQRLVAHVM
jgi:tetratricopeptide (TPR) repeat protein